MAPMSRGSAVEEEERSRVVCRTHIYTHHHTHTPIHTPTHTHTASLFILSLILNNYAAAATQITTMPPLFGWPPCVASGGSQAKGGKGGGRGGDRGE